MWNDTDIPLAYLLTFRCYGTWLHGDERGSIDRFNNRYQTPYIAPNARWKKHNEQKLNHAPVVLEAIQRQVVETAIRESCVLRNWQLMVVNVRTNHAHTVVVIGELPPGRALNAFKTNATRQMRESGCWLEAHSPWADKGSKRHLWTEESVQRAIDYVINGQGGPLPDFD